MADLSDLASKLEGLREVCKDAVRNATPEIRAGILKMGRTSGGGPLRAGNAAVAEVSATDTTIHMRMVNSSDRNARSWIKWVEKTLLGKHTKEAFENRMR